MQPTKLTHFILRELITCLLLLVGATLLAFLLLRVSGDPVLGLVNIVGKDPEEIAQIKKALGLDKPILLQYASWVARAAKFDLGYDLEGRPVAGELTERFSRTLILTCGALGVSLLLSLPISIMSSLRRHRLASSILSGAIYFVSAIPVFLLGYFSIYAALHTLRILPTANFIDQEGRLGMFLIYALPIAVLGVGSGIATETIRYLRERIARVLREEYVRTARAKGASVVRHISREGIALPLVAVVASKIPHLLGGAIVVEIVFQWEGLGAWAWDRALARDHNAIMGITLAAAILVRFGNLMQALLHTLMDPRARS
ncbi:MAG: ABC transporter permease [bacterium]